MGENYYSYGIAPNRKTLETLFRYSHQQGLSSRNLTIEEWREFVSEDIPYQRTCPGLPVPPDATGDG